MTSTQTSLQSMVEKSSILIGNRVPKDFFVTSGTGESDITIHAGSYHLALLNANIEHLNIMTYSSILPGIANKTNYNPRKIPHGAVLETICACRSVEKGQRATAAIIWGWLYDKKTGEKYGGLVCEYSDTGTECEAKTSLELSLNELYTNGYSEKYELKDIEFVSRSIVAQKKYGTALVALGFVSYEVPLFE